MGFSRFCELEKIKSEDKYQLFINLNEKIDEIGAMSNEELLLYKDTIDILDNIKITTNKEEEGRFIIIKLKGESKRNKLYFEIWRYKSELERKYSSDCNSPINNCYDSLPNSY